SRHLAGVRHGDEIVVTDHGHPIARIIPVTAESGIESLARAGLATMPTTPRRTDYPAPVTVDGVVSDVIAESTGRY
ncbi:MAG: type II toxin-antitoxin system prevent-host-death family antitoxin, partial [Actinobacteria bacterium]|nr:type II toxin-antitoxin system prevent-host-death family antitoxin [Actinomycetota bacterium]